MTVGQAPVVAQSGVVAASPDTLIVRYRKGENARTRATVHARMGATAEHRFDLIPAEVVRIAPGANRDAVAAAYKAQPEIEYVQPNYRYTAVAVPDDVRFRHQWGLSNDGSKGGVAGADIDAVAAWDRETGDRSVVVAVIDTGIDYDHPDLRQNMWTNEGERDGIAGVDDDDNGIVDDIYGARFTYGTGAPTNGDPFDDHFHGTHVAGIIGAVGNNGAGVAGVNHAVSLMALKFLNGFGGGYTADAVGAIEYAVSKGALLSNNSWGGPNFDMALRDAIAAAGEAGHLFVVAAGNRANDIDVDPFYPAAYPSSNVTAVGSTTRRDELSAFSNYGPVGVAIAAPGSEIMSTVPFGAYHAYSGTSMAAPHVAGAAAMLFAHVPGARFSEVQRWILDGADHLPSLDGFVAGGRRLNLNGALVQANPRAGVVSFDRDVWGCSAELSLRLRDIDLAGTTAASVVITGASGDSETVALLEGGTAGVFFGTLGLRTDGVVAVDGLLAVSHGDGITATYQDADTGGGPGESVAEASLDCIAPTISNVVVTAVTGLSATIRFDSDESVLGQVRYGTACSQLNGVDRNSVRSTAPEIELHNLASQTHYYFAVEAVDAAGTTTIDDNAGACYEFTTPFLQNYFTQVFPLPLEGQYFALEGQSLTFTPDGSGHFYSVCREPTLSLGVDPSGGTPAYVLGDEWVDTFEVVVGGGQHVHLYGQAYDRFHVNRNGSITFDAAHSGERVDLDIHFAQPRLSVIGHFFNIERGWVSAKQLSDRVVVTYQHERNYYHRSESDAQAELFFDGRIRLTVASLDAERAHLIGLSAGGGKPADFIESDLAAAPRCTVPAPTAVPLAGQKLIVKYKAYDAKTSMRLIVRDPALAVPAPGSSSDPTRNGATLSLFNPHTGERDVFYLAAPYWKSESNGYVYEYVDSRGNNRLMGHSVVTPCDQIKLEPGFLKVRCKGDTFNRTGFSFTLDELGGQGDLATLLTFGVGDDAVRYCTLFGGRIGRDQTWDWRRTAKFIASRAPATSACPWLP